MTSTQLRWGALLWALLVFAACERDRAPSPTSESRVERAPTKATSSSPMEAELAPPASSAEPVQAPPVCPSGMLPIPGGAFWVGSAKPTFEGEENPRFRTRVAAFCADATEVTAAAYEACVGSGKCTPVSLRNFTCNSVDKGRGDHPQNCVSHEQARVFCEATGRPGKGAEGRGARLPTELEWEYLARGGSEMRDYPWGNEPPDGHACWKSNLSCSVGQFSAAAFGLSDVVGNVWEWTDSWFGPYPWPAESGRHKVYRGGSWSRRFDKWMSPTLRNRQRPEEAGSHLGFRCVADQPGAVCPYGPRDDLDGAAGASPRGGRCQFGVDEVECLKGTSWNGVRCAAKGDTERCPSGTVERPGHGCQSAERLAGEVAELDLTAVRVGRSPEFDGDCAQNQPSRPQAYRLEGGEHLARNAVGQRLGCKNRDVGVGWNSACCP